MTAPSMAARMAGIDPEAHVTAPADGSTSGDGVGATAPGPHQDPERLIDDSYAMDLIGQWLNEPEWTASTLDELAAIYRMTGRTIGGCTCTTRCDDGMLWDNEPGMESEIIGNCECPVCHA